MRDLQKIGSCDIPTANVRVAIPKTGHMAGRCVPLHPLVCELDTPCSTAESWFGKGQYPPHVDSWVVFGLP